MFLHEDFILQRFSGRDRFSFSDKILVNLKDLSQTINLDVKGNQSIKVVVTEAFGINAKIKLKQGNNIIKESVKAG
jgi:hypothetical protein